MDEKKIEIRESVVNQLMKYLSGKPFGEVVQLWNELSEDLRVSKQLAIVEEKPDKTE